MRRIRRHCGESPRAPSWPMSAEDWQPYLACSLAELPGWLTSVDHVVLGNIAYWQNSREDHTVILPANRDPRQVAWILQFLEQVLIPGLQRVKGVWHDTELHRKEEPQEDEEPDGPELEEEAVALNQVKIQSLNILRAHAVEQGGPHRTPPPWRR